MFANLYFETTSPESPYKRLLEFDVLFSIIFHAVLYTIALYVFGYIFGIKFSKRCLCKVFCNDVSSDGVRISSKISSCKRIKENFNGI